MVSFTVCSTSLTIPWTEVGDITPHEGISKQEKKRLEGVRFARYGVLSELKAI